jgi:iron(III) transport system ATP-binding protein
MVFQSYAIWPHYTVFENVAYPLKIRKFSKSDIKEKVEKVLSLVAMDHLSNRYPGELSGGQQQRVALARAVVYSPRLLLLDEPLANLDARVRESVRFEIKELQRHTKVTAIYVTHDQSEAMVLSDRILVIENGVLIQEGTASEIYCNPKSQFVASFIGTSNFITGEVTRIEENHMIVKTDDGYEINFSLSNRDKLEQGIRLLLCIRPEDFELHINRPKEEFNVFEAKIQKSAFLGNIVDYWVEMNGQNLRVQANPYFDRARQKDIIYLKIREEQIKILNVNEEATRL